jgi:hypothetical protein
MFFFFLDPSVSFTRKKKSGTISKSVTQGLESGDHVGEKCPEVKVCSPYPRCLFPPCSVLYISSRGVVRLLRKKKEGAVQ